MLRVKRAWMRRSGAKKTTEGLLFRMPLGEKERGTKTMKNEGFYFKQPGFRINPKAFWRISLVPWLSKSRARGGVI